MTTWRILSSGLSIADLDELPGAGLIVAINHAILHPTIEADYWCCHEWSRGVQDGLVRKAKGPRLETWVGQGYLHNWATWNPKRGLFGLKQLKLRAHPDDSFGFRARFEAKLAWKTKVAWGGRSFFAGLANCILRGASRVECWGVDLDGATNYGGGPAGAVTRQNYRQRTNPEAQRWPYERKNLALATTEAADHGVEVIRMTA